MALFIRNMQRLVKLDMTKLQSRLNTLVSCTKYSSFDIGLLLVCNDHIKELNQQYRGFDEVTDVLAFPYHEISVESAGNLPDVHPEEHLLGDIVLGLPYIASECSRQNEDFDCTLVTMFTHGLCHLVGFDHEREQDWRQMYKEELNILDKFYNKTAMKCTPLLKVGHYVME